MTNNYKVAVIWLREIDRYEYNFTIAGSITDWDEVDAEQYEILVSWVNRLRKKKYSRFTPALVVRDTEPIATTIAACVAEAEKDKLAQAKAEAKRKAINKKNKQNILERKKKQLEKLKKELGET